MGFTTISVLLYALWPLLTLAIVSLWIAAMVDIAGHRRTGLYTRTRLSCIAAAVSVVAVIAIVGIGAVFAGQRHQATAKTGPWIEGQEKVAQNRTFLFSFGLEHAPHSKPVEPANDGSVTGTR